jgi:hypothetical protein
MQLLESWHTTYMEVRSRIEDSGTDHRWEFDRKRLFEQVLLIALQQFSYALYTAYVLYVTIGHLHIA